MDGGFVENIIVDSLRSINTGNVIFLRIGERIAGKKGRSIILQFQMYIPFLLPRLMQAIATKVPVEDLPRNISPLQ
ncbi:MAG: hypothetical protein R2744_13400 [Bacteroidales bacterium]